MHLLRSVPNAAVMFLSFEIMGEWFDGKAAERGAQYRPGEGAGG